MIPKSFVQELLNRVDIADVIESHLPLKRAGANLVACCPFHSEKTPSFTVSPTKQFYHCFGCGAHGTALGFLMEYSGLGFVEAVKELAQRVGLQVPEVQRQPRHDAPEQGESADDLAQVLQRAAGFYKAELKKSERAIAYLKGRGLTGEIAGRFGLGYAPAGWQPLSAAFTDYDARGLVEAGLVIQGEEGKRYDRFRDRIMFPIVSQRGQVIGFGGRVLDKSEPKYLNSPETPLFEKGRELYGLFQARQGIRRAGRALVVEGYMDVVALAQFAIDYAVATLGTATTPWQVQKLLRQTDEVVFCFDGDAAGRRAAWRALENSLEQLQDGKQVRFLFLPPEHDPDSFVRSEGREALERLLAEAVPLSAFALKELSSTADMTTAEGRAKFLQDAKPLVRKVSAPMLGLMLRKRVAELGGITQGELEQRFELGAPRRGAQAPIRAPRRGSDLYAKLLERVLAEPVLLDEVVADLAPGDLVAMDTASAEARALADLIEQRRGLSGALSVPGAMELLRQGGHEAVLKGLLPAVQDLQRLGPDELRLEVRGLVQALAVRAEHAEVKRALDGVQSPRDLSEAARALVTRALARGKVVQND
jgi:DNA primase